MMSNLIEDAITEYFGERCDDYEKNCVCCKAWQEYDIMCLALRIVAVETATEIEKWKLKKETENE
jgi:hypothetical protein